MIICCGESLIDMIPSENSIGHFCFDPHPGGAVFNTSIALGRLGISTQFLSGVSSDFFGEMITNTLIGSNVDTDYLIIQDKPTTLAFVRLVNGQAKYTFYDENTAGRSIDSEQIPSLSEKISTIYFGGISLISEPCSEFYEALILREADNKIIMLDPNIRPDFVYDECKYRSRLHRLIAQSDILKVSDEDLNWIVPGPESLNDKLSNLLNNGPSIIILTKGSEGAKAVTLNGLEVSISAPKTAVVDTVGAGDTFNAGFLAKLSEFNLLSKNSLINITDELLKPALEFGAKVAAITVSRAGANPPWVNEL